jgi:hypothetical protein
MTQVSLQSQIICWLASALSGDNASDPQNIESVLGSFYKRLAAFRRELGDLSEHSFHEMLPRSRETPTHYKWHLFANDDDGVQVWLHEYKPKTTRSGGYAQTIHNHRYSMSALLLTGGYCYRGYKVTINEDGLHADVQVADSWDICEGGAYSMTPDEFHSVTEIQDGTVSLMIQGRAVRPHSTSIEPGSGRLIHHLPIEHRFGELRSALGLATATYASRADERLGPCGG